MIWFLLGRQRADKLNATSDHGTSIMSPDDFYSLLRAKPFVPFRVVTSDGAIYEVQHPDLVMVGFPSVIIGYPDPRAPFAYQRYDIVSMRHIVRLEPMSRAVEDPQSAAGNGEGQTGP